MNLLGCHAYVESITNSRWDLSSGVRGRIAQALLQVRELLTWSIKWQWGARQNRTGRTWQNQVHDILTSKLEINRWCSPICRRTRRIYSTSTSKGLAQGRSCLIDWLCYDSSFTICRTPFLYRQRVHGLWKYWKWLSYTKRSRNYPIYIF
jgi:hypothetical protein